MKRMYYTNQFTSESRGPAGNELLRLRNDNSSNVWLLFLMAFYLKVSKAGKGYCFFFFLVNNGETEAENSGGLPQGLIEGV